MATTTTLRTHYPTYPSKSHFILNAQKQEDVNPGFFIVRPNGGPLVPLIPIDELPEGLEFLGLKRSIEVEETIGMGNLGIRWNRVGVWKLIEKATDNVVGSGNSSPPAATKCVPAKGKTVSTMTPTLPHQQPIKTLQSPQPPPPSLASSYSSTKSSPNPNAIPTKPRSSGIIGPFEPQICRHWCTYGICKWAQNCRYLHIMPTSREGLRDVGLADWPNWWKTLVGMPTGPRDVGVYPTGPRERFSRGLDIDYGRMEGNIKLAREWEDRLRKQRMMSGKNGPVGMVGGKKTKAKKTGLAKPEYLKTVVQNGQIIGVTVGDGSALKKPTDNTITPPPTTKPETATKPTIPSNGINNSKYAPTQPTTTITKKTPAQIQTEKSIQTTKKLDQDVARATRAWEDDESDEEVEVPVKVKEKVKGKGKGRVGENKENEVPKGMRVGTGNGILVDI